MCCCCRTTSSYFLACFHGYQVLLIPYYHCMNENPPLAKGNSRRIDSHPRRPCSCHVTYPWWQNNESMRYLWQEKTCSATWIVMSHCSPLWYRSSRSAPRPEADSRVSGAKLRQINRKVRIKRGWVCDTHNFGIMYVFEHDFVLYLWGFHSAKPNMMLIINIKCLKVRNIYVMVRVHFQVCACIWKSRHSYNQTSWLKILAKKCLLKQTLCFIQRSAKKQLRHWGRKLDYLFSGLWRI